MRLKNLLKDEPVAEVPQAQVPQAQVPPHFGDLAIDDHFILWHAAPRMGFHLMRKTRDVYDGRPNFVRILDGWESDWPINLVVARVLM